MNPIGIYEKALPNALPWVDRFKVAKKMGFDFVEMSIDEKDHRLARLNWSNDERKAFVEAKWETGIRVPTMCLSGHRRFPLGSHDERIRQHGLDIMKKAINLADDLGIRVIQLAGYDVYYEEKDEQTRDYYIENLKKSCAWAAEKAVILAVEIMDDPFLNSITKYREIAQVIQSPWFKVYPDLGNLSAWQENNPSEELILGKQDIAAIHLKDTQAVTKTSKGKFRDVPFGTGCVDFVKLLKTLKALNYSGSFTIEMWSEENNAYQTKIADALTYLLPNLKEAGYDYEGKFERNQKESLQG